MKDPIVYVDHILESIADIISYTNGLSWEEFLNDKEKQDAVIRKIEIIGEAARNIPTDFTKQHRYIPWKVISGMRNKLIHEYFSVDLALVWQVVQKDLPKLKVQLEKLLNSR